ncbi:hypothetical protein RB195_004592 [Necator americanus]|uniref:G-protein coupled receptors family 1 profile domain-containing protein n=1 Tax=Necator americanus TaxID=51031 RepID=A0ABR1BKH0_NECAM
MFVNILPTEQDNSEVGMSECECDRSSSSAIGTPTRDIIYWALYSTDLLLMMFSFILNVFLSIILFHSVLKHLCCSFYKVMLAFVVTTSISSASDILSTIYMEGLRYNSEMHGKVTLLISLVASYYTAMIIFLLGLNRFAAFCSAKLNNSVMNSKILSFLLLLLLGLSTGFGVVIIEVSGFSRTYDNMKDIMMQSAQNTVLLTISNYIFYTIPLVSTLFYVACFISLRSKRSLVRAETTISLLDNAENSTLKQGIVIVFFYLLSLAIHIFLRFHPPMYTSYFVLSRLEIVSSTAPQLAIPIITLMYSRRIREYSWSLLGCNPLRSSFVKSINVDR